MNLVKLKEEEYIKENILPSSTSQDYILPSSTSQDYILPSSTSQDYILPNSAVEDTVFVRVEDIKTENEIKSKYT